MLHALKSIRIQCRDLDQVLGSCAGEKRCKQATSQARLLFTSVRNPVANNEEFARQKPATDLYAHYVID